MFELLPNYKRCCNVNPMTNTDKADTGGPGYIAGRLLKERGKTAGWLADTVGVSANSISTVLKDKSPKSTLWPSIAEALGVPISALYREDIQALMKLAPEYTLSNAPECLSPYVLQIDDELDFIPPRSSLWIGPLTESTREQSKIWLFLPQNSARRLLLRAVFDSEGVVLVDSRATPMSRQRGGEYIPGTGGQVLGVALDIASCEQLFQRQV